MRSEWARRVLMRARGHPPLTPCSRAAHRGEPRGRRGVVRRGGAAQTRAPRRRRRWRGCRRSSGSARCARDGLRPGDAARRRRGPAVRRRGAKQLTNGGWSAWSPPEKSADWTAMVEAAALRGDGRPPGGHGDRLLRAGLRHRRGGEVGAEGGRRRELRSRVPARVPQGHAGRFVAAAKRDVGAPSDTTRENRRVRDDPRIGHRVVEKALQGDGSVGRVAAAVGWSGNRLYDIGRVTCRARSTRRGRRPSRPGSPRTTGRRRTSSSSRWRST